MVWFPTAGASPRSKFEADLLEHSARWRAQGGGLFTAGTPFSDCPTTIRCPSRSTIGQDVRIQILYLAVPLRPRSAPESSWISRGRGRGTKWCRHEVRELQASNDASGSGDPALLEVGNVRHAVLLANEVTRTYDLRPARHFVELPRGQDRSSSARSFYSTVMHLRTAGRLAALPPRLGPSYRSGGESAAGRVGRERDAARQPSSPTF